MLAAASAKTRAALGSVLFLAVAPGVAAGLVPWLLTGWDADGDVAWPFVAAGVVLVAAGAGVLLHAFGRFVVEGLGTPAPVAPPEQLVVGGLYRYVRNPMYLAVAATIVGQALDPRPPGAAPVRGRLRRRGLRLRAELRGADAGAAVRCRLRGVSARRAGLVAARRRAARRALRRPGRAR